MHIYTSRGFQISDVHADGEFECLRNDLAPIHLEIAPPDEHIHDIERSIRTIKEGTRCIVHGLPYKRYPRAMVHELLNTVVRNNNQLPAENGISDNVSPKMLITGTGSIDYNKLQLEFGTYVQLHESNERTNTQQPRTVGAIALSMSPNAGGHYRFLNLNTGRIVQRRNYTVVPITKEVIARVEELAIKEGQPEMVKGSLLFAWKENEIFDDTHNEYEVDNSESNTENMDPEFTDEEEPDIHFIPVHDEPSVERPELIRNDGTNTNGVITDDEDQRDIAEGSDDGPTSDGGPMSDASSYTSDEDWDDWETSDEDTSNDDLSYSDYSETSDLRTNTPNRESEEIINNRNDNVRKTRSASAANRSATRENRSADIDADEDDVESHTEHANASDETQSRKTVVETVDMDRDVDEDVSPKRDNNNDTSNRSSITRGLLEMPRTTSGGMRLRPRRGRSYRHRLVEQMNEGDDGKSYGAQFMQLTPTKENRMKQAIRMQEAIRNMNAQPIQAYKEVCAYVFMQMSAEAGIKRYGQKAIDALYKEFAQLNELSVFEAVCASDLTDQQRRDTLPSINLIKEKRCGKIKGRSVADGRKQRKYYSKSDITSPTVSSDSLLMSLVIDAKEGRAVGTADVPGAYLQAEMTDFVIVKMTGSSVDVMCQVNPDFSAYVISEGKRKVLYLRLNKALYGCIQSAMLWYNTFSDTLKDMGFELNPYDPCVANKMINGKQCTVLWYVDDLKVSHMEESVVENVLKCIEERFSGELTITMGQKHKYLGMDITFTEEGTVEIRMDEYVKEAIDAFGEDIRRPASTPAKSTLFKEAEGSPRLEGAQEDQFKHIVAKLLYVSKRCRLDIQLAIGYLCTQVSRCTKDDWLKLRRVLEYLHGTRHDYLTLGAHSLCTLHTGIDASFAVHRDMRSHTGGFISLGRGGIMSKSSKQKINTDSTTTSELVGCSDYAKAALWGQLFLKAQGYETQPILYQDNESAIKLERNGRRSCGQKTRHIDIRYFYLKDLLDQRKIDIKYCPTEQMIADFLTKPLQGGLFQKLRDVIMGQIDIHTFARSTAAKEREEENNIDGGQTANEHTTGRRKEQMSGER